MGKKSKGSNKQGDEQDDLRSDKKEDKEDKDSISSFEKISIHSKDSESESPVVGDSTIPNEIIEETSTPTLESQSPSLQKIDPVVRELEEAAAVVAAASREAAAAAQEKIYKGAAEAKAFMSSLFSVFDDSIPKTVAKDDDEFRRRLGLHDDETILETFRCKMLQSYSPSSNSFTAAKTIGFSGQLHIATSHICFEFDGAIDKPVSIPKSDIVSFSIEHKTALEIKLSANRSLVVGQFSFQMEVESAVLLLERLLGDAA